MINATARGSLTLATVIASVLGSAQVRADEDQAARATSGGIEEVIVTAQRKEESLQDVSLSVSAVSADSLVTRGINNISDVRPGMIPGVFVTQFSGGQNVLAINIRGVTMSDPTQGTVELTVPVYIDGVFLGRGQGLGLDLIDPERVEILRGPQGQLFGRNAEGGVVQFVTRKPTGEWGMRASASLGNYNEQLYKLSVDLPEVGGFSTQLSAMKRKHDPYVEMSKNSLYPGGEMPPGPHVGHLVLDSSGFRAAIRYQNHENLTADYSYDYSDQFASEGLVTWLPLDVIGRPPVSPMPAYDGELPSKSFDRYYNLGFRSPVDGHALTLNYQLNDRMSLKSITSYRTTERHGSNTLGAALPAGVSSNGFVYTLSKEDVAQNQTSQEFQFIGTWDQWDLTAGATYFNEQVSDMRRSRLTGPGIQPGYTFISPGTLGYCAALGLDPCPASMSKQKAESNSYGLYAQASYRPAAIEPLELTLGARYTDDTKEARRIKSSAGPLPPTPWPLPPPEDFTASRVDPAASVSWKFTDDIRVYLRYATGYRAGGANVRSSNFSIFQEEENEAWELGLKSQFFSDRLQVNLAAFHNTIKGEQLTIQENPTVNPSLTNTFNNPFDKKVKGLEAEVQWAPIDVLRLGLNLTYTDSGDDWVEYDNPFTATVGDYARFYTIASPELAGSFTVDYNQPLGVGELAMHAGYAYSDDYWATPGAQLVASFGPNYDRPTGKGRQLDARVGWKNIEATGGVWEIALWGKNLTDESEIVYGFDGCAFGGGHCGFRQNPMTYGIEVRYEH